ncbi:MAG: type II toxin-antitoxin system HipA family toxin [Rhodospirillaceae bacterium]|nr:MAG: type II toxin-antitoxin system HipA family toxin [Rhodospirillaceae bacterium]
MSEPSRIIFCWHDGGFVPCGRLERIAGDQIPAGRSSRFIYAKSWLARSDAFPLDPERLPLIETWQGAPDGHQLHGIFRDAAPDGWGQRIIDKRFQGTRLGDFDYLSAAGDHRVGMLGIGIDPKGATGCVAPDGTLFEDPDAPMPLEVLQEAAMLFEKGAEIPPKLAPYLNFGGSPGGARAKASFRDHDGQLWVAKFSMSGDEYNEPRAEGAVLSLARACGIDVPEHMVTEVGNHTVLLVRRFDRPMIDGQEQRLGFLSLQTLLAVEPTRFYAGKSYADMAAAVRRIGEPAGAEIFRRLLFNALIGNNDDHLRNHAVIRKPSGEWTLSPAFDLVPQPKGDKKHVLRFATSFDASIADAMQSHAQLGVTSDDAKAIVKKVIPAVRSWRNFMQEGGVSDVDIEKLAPAFSLADHEDAKAYQ